MQIANFLKSLENLRKTQPNALDKIISQLHCTQVFVREYQKPCMNFTSNRFNLHSNIYKIQSTFDWPFSNELVKAMTVHIIRFLMGYVYSVFAAFTFNLCKWKSINYTFWIIPDKRSGYLYNTHI